MIEFTRAAAGSRNVILIAAVPEESEPFAPETRIFRYDHAAEGDKWFYDDLDFDVQSICLFHDPDRGSSYFCLLSSEGDVYHNLAGGIFREKISEAGAAKLGRLSCLKQIGQRLYAAGDGGQIWRRETDGNWALLTRSALNSPAAKVSSLPQLGDPDFMAALKDPTRNPFLNPTAFLAMDGFSEDAIYIVGLGGDIRFWDGERLNKVDSGTNAALTNLSLSDGRVWVCGREGTVLHGNLIEGFAQVADGMDHRLYTSIQAFEGDIWLASDTGPSGIFKLARYAERPERVLGPPRDAFVLTQAEGVMWAIGSKSVARLTADGWRPVKHPDL